MAAASKPIHIPDNFEGYDLEQFVIPEHYAADLCHTLIPHGFIQSRTQKVAADIFKRYLVLGCKHVPIAFDFIRVKSYQVGISDPHSRFFRPCFAHARIGAAHHFFERVLTLCPQGTESNCKPTIEATGCTFRTRAAIIHLHDASFAVFC
eukprot:6198673-Pleurochrysis_carterae.AAC.1